MAHAESETGTGTDPEPERVRESVARAMARRAGDINDREFRVIVPKFDNAGQKINVGLIEGVAERIADRFGGVTVFPTTLGCWQPEDGGLMCEENVVMSTVRDSTDNVPIDDDQAWFRDLARNIGKDFGQFSVMVAEDAIETDFIEGEPLSRLEGDKVGRDPFRELI